MPRRPSPATSWNAGAVRCQMREQDGLDPAALVAWLLARGAKPASELG